MPSPRLPKQDENSVYIGDHTYSTFSISIKNQDSVVSSEACSVDRTSFIKSVPEISNNIIPNTQDPQTIQVITATVPSLFMAEAQTQTPTSLIRSFPKKDEILDKLHLLQSKVDFLKSQWIIDREKAPDLSNITLENFKELCDRFLPNDYADSVKMCADLHNNITTYLQVC